MARVSALAALGTCALLVTLEAVFAAGPSPYAVGWAAHRIANLTQPIGIKRVGNDLFGLSSTQSSAPASRMVMWRSSDGVTWTPVPLSSRAFPPGISVTGIVHLESRYVAVGGTAGATAGQFPGAAVWLSANGRDWSRVRDQPAFHGAVMSAVAANGNTIVAGGSISTNGREPVSRERGTVWASRDGATWTQISSTAFSGASIFDVISMGRRFVAVGDSYPAPPPYGSHAVVWVSSDGFTWRRLPRLPGVFVNGSAMSRVVLGARGLVGFGITEPPNPDYRTLLWTSPDGLRWHLVAGDPFKHGLVSAMTPAGSQYVAIGEADGDPVLWASGDGTHWQLAADGAVFTGANTLLFDVTSLGGHLIVSGARGSGPVYSRIPVIWVWTPGSTARPGPTPVRLEARSFRLRFPDLPPGYSSGMDSFALICDLEDRPDPGGQCHRMLDLLGNYSAYYTEFDRLDGRGQITGTTILVPSAANAQKVLRDPHVLLEQLGAPAPQRVATGVRIGQEFRLYRVQIQKHSYAQGESPYWDGTGGIWRNGRAIAIVEVTDTGRQADDLVIRLAKAMFARL